MIPKFRGWTKEGKLVKGYYFKFPAGSPNTDTFIIDYKSGRSFTDNLIKVIPETVGQFTGRKDKNDVEIYGAVGKKGGDIIRYNYHLETPDDDFVTEVIYDIRKVRCGDGEAYHIGFILRGKEKDGELWYTDFPDVKDIEVIGTI